MDSPSRKYLNLLRWLHSAIPIKRIFICLLAFGLIAQGVELWALGVFAIAIQSAPLDAPWMLVFALFFIKCVWSVAYNLLVSHWSLDLRYSIRDKLLRTGDRLNFQLGAEWIEERLAFLGRQLPESVMTAVNGSLQVLLGAVFAVGWLILLYRFEAELLALGVVIFLVASGISYLWSSWVRPWADKVWRHDLAEDQRWTDELGVWRERQYLGLSLRHSFFENFRKHRASLLRRDVLRFVLAPLLELSFLAALIAAAIWSGSQQNQYATVITLALFIQRLMSRVQSSVLGIQQLRDEMPLWNQMETDLLMETQESRIAVKNGGSGLTFRSLSAGFADRNLISDLSMSVEPGDWLWLKGKNGSGKTTLARIVAGLLEPRSGLVECGRTQIIGPTPYLIKGDLYESLTLGRQISRERVEKVLCDFHLDEPFRRLGLFGSDLNIRHVHLSRGETQMIGLARGLLDFQDVLILDEATSALSLDVEGDVLQRIKLHRPATVVIFISHHQPAVSIISRTLDLDHLRESACATSSALSF